MKTTCFHSSLRWLVPVIAGVTLLLAPSTQAQDQTAVPDYSGGVAKFLQLGLTDVKDAKYIHIENNYGFYDHDGMLGDSQIKLTGNAWLLKDLGNGRVQVLVDSLKVIELVEAKIFEEEQRKKMEARMKAMQKKAEDDLEEEDYEEIMGMNDRVQGGKWKDADLKKDLATVLARLKSDKPRGEFDFQFNNSVGKTFLFAAHAMQKGHKDEANAIIDQLFKITGDNRKVLGRAMGELADAQYAEIFATFNNKGDWASYLKGMDELLAKYPAVWRDKPVIQKVADAVRKQIAAGAAPEISGDGISDEDKQLAKELAEYKDGLRDNHGSLQWLIAKPKADTKQKLDPMQRIMARGVRSVPLLVALMKDNHLVRLKTGSSRSYTYYSSDDDDVPTEDEINEKYEGFSSRPKTRGELAKALLDDLVVKREDMFNADRRPTTEEIGNRVMEWYAKHKDKKPGELQRHFLAEGDEHVQQMAMWALMQSKDEADHKALEEHLLKPEKVAENLSHVVSYAQQRGSKAKPLVEKFLAKAKAAASLVPANRLEHADERFRKMLEKQAKDQLTVLENLMSDKKASVLLDEYAASDRKWTQQEWGKVDDALWAKLREEDTDTAITLLLEASLKSESDFLAWAFLQGVSQAQYFSAMKNRDADSSQPIKPETLKIEKHAELWKKILQQKRELPASYRAYAMEMPSFAETAAGIIDSLYSDPAAQMRNYQMSQTLGSKLYRVYLARAEARLAGKELPEFPDKTKVSDARKAEIKKQLEDSPPAALTAIVAKYSIDEQLALTDIVGADAKLNEKLSPGTHIITELIVPENRPELKKIMESHKGKPLTRALVEAMVTESQKLLPQKVTPMMVVRRGEPLAGLKVTIAEPDMSELGRFSYGGNRNQGMITAQLSCMDSSSRINAHAQWVVNLPEQAKAAAGKDKKDDDDLLVEAAGRMGEHYAKQQEEFWKKLEELMEPKVNAFAPYQVMIMCMLPGKDDDEN